MDHKNEKEIAELNGSYRGSETAFAATVLGLGGVSWITNSIVFAALGT